MTQSLGLDDNLEMGDEASVYEDFLNSSLW